MAGPYKPARPKNLKNIAHSIKSVFLNLAPNVPIRFFKYESIQVPQVPRVNIMKKTLSDKCKKKIITRQRQINSNELWHYGDLSKCLHRL